MKIRVLGVDPGKTGAYSLIDVTTKKIEYGAFPLYPNDEIDPATFYKELLYLKPTHIFIEDVHSIFGTSAKSNFSFGKSVGIAQAICSVMNLPTEFVKPKEWQKQVWTGVRVKNPKINSLTTAVHLFPKESFLRNERCKTPHDGIVDATLIAYYGTLKLSAYGH